MKRTNVVVDEELLKKARRVGGEKTYSATIAKALDEFVRKREFWSAYKEWAEETRKGGTFWPGYLEELRPPSRAVLTKPKARMSAHQKCVPQRRAIVAVLVDSSLWIAVALEVLRAHVVPELKLVTRS